MAPAAVAWVVSAASAASAAEAAVGGCGGVPFRVFVKVQMTTSPCATAPSTLVPVTETSTVPLRVHSTLES